MGFHYTEQDIANRLMRAKLPGCTGMGFKTVHALLEHVFANIDASYSGFDFADHFKDANDLSAKLMQEAQTKTNYYFDRVAQAIAETVKVSQKSERPILTADKMELEKIARQLTGLTDKNRELRTHSPTIIASVLKWTINKTLEQAHNSESTRDRDLSSYGRN